MYISYCKTLDRLYNYIVHICQRIAFKNTFSLQCISYSHLHSRNSSTALFPLLIYCNASLRYLCLSGVYTSIRVTLMNIQIPSIFFLLYFDWIYIVSITVLNFFEGSVEFVRYKLIATRPCCRILSCIYCFSFLYSFLLY